MKLTLMAAFVRVVDEMGRHGPTIGQCVVILVILCAMGGAAWFLWRQYGRSDDGRG